MIRNIKALGLALLAVFALCASIAATASAQIGTLTSTGPVTLIGLETGEASANQIAAFGGTTQCATSIYTGHKFNVTPHTFIPNDVSTITVKRQSGICTTKIGAASFPSTIDMTGCDFELHLEGTTPGVDTYTVKTRWGCKVWKIRLFATMSKHTSAESFCEISITPNLAGYLGFHATDTTNGRIDAKGTISGISADKKSPTGSILCPEETTNSATFSVDVTVEGWNEGGTPTSISLSHL